MIKNRKVGLVLVAILLNMAILFFSPEKISAADVKVIDRVEIAIDVPVDGVKLKEKATVLEYMDADYMQTAAPNTATEVISVVWYKSSATTEPLSSGYKAKIGESYKVCISLKTKEGYAFADNMSNYANKINDLETEEYELTDAKGTIFWRFDCEFETIPAVSGKPVVVVKDMVLTPYEGNPMEMIVEATGTNLKYQWQICYEGFGSDNEVDLDDNYVYGGTKTSHFKLFTYFGSTIDEDMNFAKVRCKVTGDNGTGYSQEAWFVIRDREVLSEMQLSDLTVPALGAKPDYTLTSLAPEKYNVSKVQWYGPKKENGRYGLMRPTRSFEAGEYLCKIFIEPTEAYKFDANTEAYVNRIERTLQTISGKDAEQYTADSYYINIPFTVTRPDNSEDPDDPVLPDNPDEEIPDNEVNPFTDVNESDYYYKAVLWAVENDITSGVSDTQFGPNEICSRAQAVAFLWRNAGRPEPVGDNNPFVDVAKTAYYYKAVMWAVENGITAGTSKTEFSPDAKCTRAQIVSFLWRSNGKIKVTADNPFEDVSENAYYYDAVLWAVENKITAGVTKTSFGPDKDCIRAQIVTFLYRISKEE